MVDIFERKRERDSRDRILSLDCVNIRGSRVIDLRVDRYLVHVAMTSFRREWVGITSEAFEKELWRGFNLLVSRLTLNHP